MIDPYLALPREILHQILLPLDVEDRFNCINVNKLWRNFITSDTALWRSSIVVRAGCDAEILQRCLNYAFGTSSQSIALGTVKIVVSRDDSESTLHLLSKGLFNQRVKQIDCLSVEIEDSGDLSEFDNMNIGEWESQVTNCIYLLVPIANFHLAIHGDSMMIRLDTLIESQAKSLTHLYLYCYSVAGQYHINRAPVHVYPMLQELYLSFQNFSKGGIQTIFGCTNLRLLELTNIEEMQYKISINHLLNNIPDGLQSLRLAHLYLSIDSQDGNRGWSNNLSSLKLVNITIGHGNGIIFGSLEGLRELLICNRQETTLDFLLTSLKRINGSIDRSEILGSLGDDWPRIGGEFDVDEFFDKYKCGPSLRSLYLDYTEDVPDPNLYQNVERLYLGDVFLGNSFLSDCYKLTKVKDVELDGVNISNAEIVECLITLAKNNLETVHLPGRTNHVLLPSDIEKINNLGVVVLSRAPVDSEGVESMVEFNPWFM